jgi:hypothetical protein
MQKGSTRRGRKAQTHQPNLNRVNAAAVNYFARAVVAAVAVVGPLQRRP